MEHGKIKFILLDKVGEAAIYQDVTPEEMLTVLERVEKSFQQPARSRITGGIKLSWEKKQSQ